MGLMDGRIERLLERLGVKQSGFPAGLDLFFEKIPGRGYADASFAWQEYKWMPSAEPLRTNETVVWRSTFTTDTTVNYSWKEMDLRNSSVNYVTTQSSTLPNATTWTYTVQGY